MRLIVVLLVALVFVQTITYSNGAGIAAYSYKTNILGSIKSAVMDAMKAGSVARLNSHSYNQLAQSLQLINGCNNQCNIHNLFGMLMQSCGQWGAPHCSTCHNYWQQCPCYAYPCNPCHQYPPPCHPCYYNNVLLWPGYKPNESQCPIRNILGRLFGQKS